MTTWAKQALAWLILSSCVSFSCAALASSFVPEGTDNTLGLSQAEIDALPKTADGKYAVFGDILLPIGLATAAEVPNRWPGGIVYYAFGNEISATRRAQFVAACNDWATNTPIRCQERTTQQNYILVRNHTDGSGCGGFKTSCSFVGMVGGAQDLWMYEHQWSSPRTLRHELGHALGKVHEQSRADRGNHVDIHLENAEAGSFHNFAIVPNAGLYSEYDYDSIMHYPNCAYSKHANCTGTTPELQTIVSRHCNRDVIDGGTSITELDRDGLRNAYASGLQSLLERERSSECGGDAVYGAAELPSLSAFAPVATFVSGWAKDEIKYSANCGMTPIGFGMQCTPPKKYMTHWTDEDDSLNPSCLTKHEVWLKCGCPTVTVNNVCTRISMFKATFAGLSASDKAFADTEQWRKTRVLYFQDVVDGLNAEGLLTPEVVAFAPVFYQLNYLDPHFETKMLKVRGGMDAYARWKASIEPGYKLPLTMFHSIAVNRKMRIN